MICNGPWRNDIGRDDDEGGHPVAHIVNADGREVAYQYRFTEDWIAFSSDTAARLAVAAPELFDALAKLASVSQPSDELTAARELMARIQWAGT